jgi:hypothetical protein
MRARWTRAHDPVALAETKALIEAYRGPITRCPPGVARADEAPPYAPPRRDGKAAAEEGRLAPTAPTAHQPNRKIKLPTQRRHRSARK